MDKVTIFCILCIWISPFTAPIAVIIFFKSFINQLWSGNTKIIVNSSFFAPGMLFLASSLLGAIICKNYINIIATLIIILAYIIFGVYVEYSLKENQIIPLIKIMIFLSFISAIIGFLQKAFISLVQDRIISTFYNANYYAYILEIIFILTLSIYPHIKSRNEKLIMWVINLLNIVALYLTGCRTAIFAVAVAIIFYFVITKNRTFIIFTACMLFAGLISIYINPNLIPRFSVIGKNIDQRRLYWNVAIIGIKENPLWGRGFLSFLWFAPKYGVYAPHSHNMYLNLWLEFGILGIVSIIWMFGRVIKSCLFCIKNSSYPQIGAAVLSILVASLIHGITDITMIGAQTSLIFLTVIVIPFVIEKATKSPGPLSSENDTNSTP
ncbi:O-antigen ligase family protein [Xylanivirga thermophila]|jgi:O-antigen ligase|uniref:O-antigen ligase family protein n=1 Tax=Xylanivirga thermophila TaxID=2496273 RepID=UPI00101C48C1|nr:O-antigen ligase family protein [Xylanivirga thermophila]